MKTSSKTLLTLTAAIFSTAGGAKAANIMTEDFEDGTFDFVVSDGLFHDGVTDYFTITPLNGPSDSETGSFAGFLGNNHFAAEDIDDGGTRPGTQTLTFTIGISGYESITVGALFGAGGNDAATGTPAYDAEDGFRMRYQIDGSPFQNLLAFESELGIDGNETNETLRRDTNFDGVGDGFTPDHNLLPYSGLAVTGTGTELTLVIEVTSTDGNGQFAFDHITVDGEFVIPEPSSALLALAGSALLFGRRRK